jgi:hypothetical protein
VVGFIDGECISSVVLLCVSGFTMAELRVACPIKVCFILGKTVAEMQQMLKQAFVDNSLDKTQACDWYKLFKNCRTSTDDDYRSGRLSTGITPENIVKVRGLILQD